MRRPFLYFVLAVIGGTAFFYLHKILEGEIILSQGFFLYGYFIRYYGICLAAAIATTFVYAYRTCPDVELRKNIEDMAGWVIGGGFIGARLYHVIAEWGLYKNNLLGIFSVWNGGLGIFGALLGGAVSVLVWLRIKSKPILLKPALDAVVVALPLGQIIGRFGNLFNYELLGKPWSWGLRMYVPSEFRPAGYEAIAYYIPWFLYEQIGLVIIFILLVNMRKKQHVHPLSLFLLYVFLYNALRFIIEPIRLTGVVKYGLPLTTIVSGIECVVVAGYWLTIFYDRKKA